MELALILLAALILWFVLRSKGPPAPRTAPDIAIETARAGCGFPALLMFVIVIAVMVIFLGLAATGGCDKNAESGQPGNCLDKSFTIFEDATGLQHHSSMEDWWNASANPIK